MKKISIIIVTYNSEDDIYNCLESIFSYNDIGDNLEIIIVDNLSKNVDKMFDKLSKLYAEKIILIKSDKNGGYGYGNNIGIKKATSPITMILNPDVRLIEPVFQSVLNEFQENSDLVLLGLKQMETFDKKRYSFGSLKLGVVESLLLKLFNKFDLYSQKLFSISGACFFVRTQTFKEVGLFDENIFLYGEERDLHVRLIKNKKALVKYMPSLSYLHPKEDREFSLNTQIAQLKSYLYWIKKNKYNVKSFLNAYMTLLQFKKIKTFIGKDKNKKSDYGKLISTVKFLINSDK